MTRVLNIISLLCFQHLIGWFGVWLLVSLNANHVFLFYRKVMYHFLRKCTNFWKWHCHQTAHQHRYQTTSQTALKFKLVFHVRLRSFFSSVRWCQLPTLPFGMSHKWAYCTAYCTSNRKKLTNVSGRQGNIFWAHLSLS